MRAEHALPGRRRLVVWSVPGIYLVLLAVLVVEAVATAAIGLALWIAGGVAWPFPIAVAVTAIRTSQPGGLVRRYLVNLAGTVAAAAFVIPLVGAAAFLCMWLIGYDTRNIPPILLLGGAAWTLLGLVALAVVSDKGDRYGPGGWAP